METVSHPPGGVQSPHFPCFAGLRSDGIATVLWIRSPKTGKQLNIGEPAVNTVRPLLARVAKSRSEGNPKTLFTSEELKTLVALTAAPPPTPAMPEPSAPHPERLPDVHPGTLPNATVRVEVRVIRRTPKSHLVELPDDPRGRVWLPWKIVDIGHPTDRYGVKAFYLPLWLYRKVRTQL